MPALVGRDHCWAHNPENRIQASEARRQGGVDRRRAKEASGHALPLLRELGPPPLEGSREVPCRRDVVGERVYYYVRNAELGCLPGLLPSVG